ncbi:MAG: manganese efflux pump MntP [Candidatus Dormibacteria bacterium]
MPIPLLFALLVLPLAVDTFVLGAALGIAGLPRADRLRVSLILAGFEAGMPIVGFLVGAGIGRVLGALAGYIAILVLGVAGALILLQKDGEEGEQRRLTLLSHARGLAIVDLGLGISVDELGIGFSAGMLGLSLALAVPWIAIQGFAASQAGIRFGSRLSEALREYAERAVGVALIATAVLLLALRLGGR